ncbi:MAG: PD-(D/E)XK nuclease family protein, partial [Pikeienuella sp.]
EAARARALPEAARFFAAGAVAEAAISVMIGGARVAGRIDRLVVSDKTVDFVDFKSDSAPPGTAEEAPDAYLAQMAAYRAALAGIYPGRLIAAHILWTAAPRLDRIGDARLDEALTDLGRGVARLDPERGAP